MTQAEIDALPEDGTFSTREETIEGKRVRIPVFRSIGVLWTEADEPCAVVDSNGVRWRIGWHDGVRYKRRAMNQNW